MSGGTNGKQAREEPVVGYLARVAITNIRAITLLRWAVEPVPGWNVVLGDNGAGKSTFLRAVAYLLLPADDRGSLRLDVHKWVQSGRDSGQVETRTNIQKGLQTQDLESLIAVPAIMGNPQARPLNESIDSEVKDIFSAGFGPFRRFTGGDPEYEKQFASIPRAARHLSLFEERVSLTESLVWLKLLNYKQLEGNISAATLLGKLRAFINQDGFLPGGARLDRITSEHVFFVDGNGAEVPIEETSDGYRSILSLIFELIRQLAAHYGPDHVFDTAAKAVIAPGIVLIDEVDAHLHPSWQRRIGLFLRACFPNIQFIVTTHSPLVCQAAEVGTVFRLPRPGTAEEGRMVTGVELDRLLYGDLVEAYETDAMGGIGRSDKAQALLGQLASLNRKEIDHGLTDDERKQQRRLRAIFPDPLGAST